MAYNSPLKNRILGQLSRSDIALLLPGLERVELPRRLSLEQAGKPIKHVYFLESGMASVVAKAGRDREIEAGIIGCEGVTGMALAMADDRSPHSTFMQISGVGLRLKAADLQGALARSETLSATLLRFAHAFNIQMAHTALANGRATVDERLARWLLMADDRVAGDALPLTHEFLAIMLGVRRAGVTTALNTLERQAMVETRRGLIYVKDRAKLEKAANGLYGIAERDYQRLLNWPDK